MISATNIAAWSRSGRKTATKSRIAQYILILFYGLDLPATVKIGKGVSFWHNGLGSVILDNTEIRDNAIILQNVTLGEAKIGHPGTVDYDKASPAILIDEGAIICAGAKILRKEGTLRVGKGTIIGANAVLTTSTGDNEIWAGIPARKIRNR